MDKSLIKKLLVLLCAGVVATTPITMAGCDLIENLNNNNPSVDNPVDPDPVDPNPVDPVDPVTPEKDFTGLSDTMVTVLTDHYYTNLIKNDSYDNNKHSNYSSLGRAYGAFPFTFLEDEGYDISKIKDGSLYCNSDFYIKGNDLYMNLRVETKQHLSNGDTSIDSYLTNYLLKYNVTNQEKEEIDLLHSGPKENCAYYQAPFYIQELTSEQDPEVLSETYITLDAYNQVQKNIANLDYSKGSHIIYLGETLYESSLVIATNSFLVYGSYVRNDYPKYSTQIGTLKQTTLGGINASRFNDMSIYCDTRTSINITEANEQSYLDSLETIMVYNTSSFSKTDILDTNIFNKEVD